MTADTHQDTRKRITLTNGSIINLQLVIDDLAAFNRYVVKEHGNLMQGDDVFGKTPTENCISNCLYDELSGWLDNPNMLGFTILGISFDASKIEEEEVELSTDTKTLKATTFDLLKFVGSVAMKDHALEPEEQLEELREHARDLLATLTQIANN